jgi:CTP-dependent riboflavin kinase
MDSDLFSRLITAADLEAARDLISEDDRKHLRLAMVYRVYRKLGMRVNAASVSKKLHVDEKTVRRWLKEFEKNKKIKKPRGDIGLSG